MMETTTNESIPEAGSKGWIHFPTSVCSYFRKGTCLRVGCKLFHGTEQARLELQLRGATLYRVNDGTVYPPLQTLPPLGPGMQLSASPPLQLHTGQRSATSDGRSSTNSTTVTRDDNALDEDNADFLGGKGPLTPTNSQSRQPMFSLHQPSLVHDAAPSLAPEHEHSFSRRSEHNHPKGNLDLSVTHQEIATVMKEGNPLTSEESEATAVVACLSFISGTCRRGDCKYVHLRPEIRLLPTSVCAYHENADGCYKGDACRYFHGPAALLKQMQEKGVIMYNPKTNIPYDEVPKDLEDKDVRAAMRRTSMSRQSLTTAQLTTSPGSNVLLGHAASMKSIPLFQQQKQHSHPFQQQQQLLPHHQQQQQAQVVFHAPTTTVGYVPTSPQSWSAAPQQYTIATLPSPPAPPQSQYVPSSQVATAAPSSSSSWAPTTMMETVLVSHHPSHQISSYLPQHYTAAQPPPPQPATSSHHQAVPLHYHQHQQQQPPQMLQPYPQPTVAQSATTPPQPQQQQQQQQYIPYQASPSPHLPQQAYAVAAGSSYPPQQQQQQHYTPTLHYAPQQYAFMEAPTQWQGSPVYYVAATGVPQQQHSPYAPSP